MYIYIYLNSIQFSLKRKLFSFRFEKDKGFAIDLGTIVDNLNAIHFPWSV